MIELPLNPDRDLPSLFTRALAGRRFDLDGGKPGDVHLYTALATCWRKGSETATILLRELRQLQATSSASNHYDEGPLPQALRALIYAATEVFDLYHQTIPKRLESGRGRPEVQRVREYQAAVKRLRDPVSLMCNRMKHQYREIVTGRIVSRVTGEMTFVYRINVAQDGVQLPDRDVHREGGFASFERTLHEIVHGLLRADFKAGELVRGLSDNCNVAIELKGPSGLGLARVLDGLSDRTPTVAHSEPGRFDGVQVLADKATLTRISARRVAEPTTRTMKITIDEAAPGVQVFV
jgi:hypothetical protein